MKTQLKISRSYAFVVFSFVMFISLVGMFSSTTKAQCPTTIHPIVGEPGYEPWQHDSIVVIDPIDINCKYTVYYCHRFLDSFPCIPLPPPQPQFTCTTIQRYIDSVAIIKVDGDPNPNPCGGTLSLIAKATDTVWKLPPDTTIPPCGANTAPDMTLTTNACWILKAHYPAIPEDTVDNHPARPERWVFGSCNVDSNALCYMTCKICQDGDDIVRFNCTFQSTGTPECSELSYDPRNPPYPDLTPECFLVPCAEHP